ncbi:hypothetical protein G3N30_08575 [Microbacterium lacticum]|uniref:hypothetical protein n=1 Tax=Microbacterium lacticum TaxID=33885 RepID=UPI0018B0B89E|nr:hypothetical protein [Microbacterium lacticum]MBF9336275.1 hypothetical protein [Microbacterium lacticum]
MGIFQSRPEEPTEWAGLPADPWGPRVPGELLGDASTDPAAVGDVAALGVPGVTGIVISVPIMAEPEAADAGAAEPGEASGDRVDG